MRRIKYIFLFLIISISQRIYSQGCSDPGICTIGSLNSATSSETVSPTDFKTAELQELMNASILAEKYKVGAEISYGIGDRKTLIYTSVLRMSIRLKEKMLFNIKLPYVYTEGVLGSANGLGDITMSLQNIIKSGNNLRFAYTLGVMIPTNNSNLKSKGKALPMAYQTSLGYYGALAGLTMSYKNWNGVIGYQQNFGRNKNEFTTENLITDPNLTGYDELNSKRLNFESSRQIQNSGDVILRIERRFKINKVNILAGVLPIYRLANSKIKLLDGTDVEIIGSDGLTFNLTGGINYTPNRKWRFNLNAGTPAITRKKRPDGLTRDFVVLAGVTRNFW